MKQIVDAITYEYSTGFLWWKKWHKERYYLMQGKWYHVENHELASDKMQEKLTWAFHNINVQNLMKRGAV